MGSRIRDHISVDEMNERKVRTNLVFLRWTSLFLRPLTEMHAPRFPGVLERGG
jgi:hypothetical protein